MKSFLKALAKALMIALVGREAMARTELITQDNCPSTAVDYGFINGSILRTKYGFDHSGDCGYIGTHRWLLVGGKYKYAPKVANAIYFFKEAWAFPINDFDQMMSCSYVCGDKKKCSPYLESFKLGTDAEIDNSIPSNADLLVKKGLWKPEPNSNSYNCMLEDAPITTNMCSFKFAKPV